MEAQVPDYDDEPDYHGRRSDIARVANDDELAAMFESLAADTQPPASD